MRWFEPTHLGRTRPTNSSPAVKQELAHEVPVCQLANHTSQMIERVYTSILLPTHPSTAWIWDQVFDDAGSRCRGANTKPPAISLHSPISEEASQPIEEEESIKTHCDLYQKCLEGECHPAACDVHCQTVLKLLAISKSYQPLSKVWGGSYVCATTRRGCVHKDRCNLFIRVLTRQ